MRCGLCDTPLHHGKWACDCIGRFGEKWSPPEPAQLPNVEWLREKSAELAHHAEQIARQRRAIAAERRRREFRVIGGEENATG